MQITITFDPADELDEVELLLVNLRGEAAAAPAAKATPAKKTAAKKTAAKAPAEDPEVEDGPTLEDAVARAQELVGLKLTQGVKDAVKELGAPRVSELKGDQIAEFLELVKDLDADVV